MRISRVQMVVDLQDSSIYDLNQHIIDAYVKEQPVMFGNITIGRVILPTDVRNVDGTSFDGTAKEVLLTMDVWTPNFPQKHSQQVT